MIRSCWVLIREMLIFDLCFKMMVLSTVWRMQKKGWNWKLEAQGGGVGEMTLMCPRRGTGPGDVDGLGCYVAGRTESIWCWLALEMGKRRGDGRRENWCLGTKVGTRRLEGARGGRGGGEMVSSVWRMLDVQCLWA